MKTVNSLEESGLLIKDASKTSENETKEQKSGFLSMISETLGAIVLTDSVNRPRS